ncbi:testis specific tektin [Danaus plexippus plexippus]|uniref:Testis specific tektin n=1 Tax=Danaus plexippus plexippus TaxID=278856 RepID=A0A212FLC4_DANPL|nr:testis specific tektin [Danaus plexippus plexippus]
MGSKIEYVDSSHLYATNYVRNSKAIGVLWAIFTICYAIISVVAFVTPEWIGDLETEYPRKFGLWQICRTDDAVEDCKGRLDDFTSINGFVFKIATVLVGAAVALALFTICAMLLFFFCRSTTVFHICGWLQLISADRCPKVCTDIGAFKKAAKSPEQVKEEIKAAEEAKTQKASEEKALKPPEEESEPLKPEQSGEEYLPNLKPGPDGNVDWTPLGDMTGTRPGVNKYSISRYSLSEWRNHNQKVLDPEIIVESNIVEYNAKTSMMQAFGNIDKQQSENFKRLRQKARDIFRWKVEVEKACKAITDEVELLEIERQRLKGASKVLMLPESISKECLDLRSNRFQPDLVADLAEKELIKEMNLVSEVRATLKNTLDEIEKQMAVNKAAKHRIEYDWCDKTMAYNTEATNLGLDTKSNTIMFRPGATRFGEYTAPLEYWEYFCRENVQNCEAARQKSADLRGSLNAILVNGGRKLRNQADRTDMAKLEETLRNTLQRIADMESLIENLKDSIKKMDAAMKLAQTRLDNRNNWRPHGESVRDQPHLGLIEEVKKIHETVTSLLGQLNNAERVRSDLLKKRIVLEKDIASKRKTLNIDRDRCGMVRSHYPSASELAGY